MFDNKHLSGVVYLLPVAVWVKDWRRKKIWTIWFKIARFVTRHSKQFVVLRNFVTLPPHEKSPYTSRCNLVSCLPNCTSPYAARCNLVTYLPTHPHLPTYHATRHCILLGVILLPIYQITGYHVQLAIILLLIYQTAGHHIQLTSVLLPVYQSKRFPILLHYNLIIHHWDNFTSNVIGYRSGRSWRPGQ
jgi:hypothetical protein